MNTGVNEHELSGCTTTPMSNYLKSLGLARILSRNDPTLMAFWRNDRLVIQSSMTKDEICQYVLRDYAPSPIISPWSYNKYQKTRDALKPRLESDDDRYRMYRYTISRLERTVFEDLKRNTGLKKIDKAAIDKHKLLLLKLCRNMLPDEYVSWLDVVSVLDNTEKPRFAPLLGSGANDGNFDMAENFVKCLLLVLQPEVDPKRSEEWLKASLFGGAVGLARINTVGHNPDGSGGPNSGAGFEGESMSNPWDYVLLMEGTLLFAGGVSKRLSNTSGKAMFPFAVGASNVGYATASIDDTDGGQEPASKGELWLPVWGSPSTCAEIEQVFREGRMQVGGRPAATGTEAARSVITMGTERGMDKFERFGILKRKGKQYLFVHSGALRVADEPAASLLDDLDGWYDSAVKSKSRSRSQSLEQLIRSYDGAVMRFCTTRKQRDMLEILASVGKIEAHLAMISSDSVLLQQLSDAWLHECYDGSAEFRLAASIASIQPSRKVGSIRANLERSERNNIGVWKPSKNTVSCVWKSDDDLIRNMSRVLQRRGVEGQIQSLKTIPIEGAIPAQILDIIQFLDGNLNFKKIGSLVLALSCIKMHRGTDYPWKHTRISNDDYAAIPEAYAVMKLVCPPLEKDSIRYDLSMLQLLSSGRVSDAYAKAAYMLHSHGFAPHSYDGRTKLSHGTTVSTTVKNHILASLLFPISNQTRNLLLRTVTSYKHAT